MAFAACSGKTAAPSTTNADLLVAASAPAAAAAAPVDDAAATALAGSGSIIIAGEGGVQEVDERGKLLHTFSATRGSAPRFVTARSVVFLSPVKAAGKTAAAVELRLLDLDTRAERSVARLPGRVAVPCNRQGWDVSLQDPDDFSIHCGRYVTLSLADRNANMFTAGIDLTIDLRDGKTLWSKTSVMDDAGCKAKIERGQQPPCDELGADRDKPSPTDDKKFVYRFELDRVLRADKNGERTLIRLRGFESQGLVYPSPSGRWTVLRGNEEQGDYVHAQLLLLDRLHGWIFPVAHAATDGKLRPLTQHALEHPDKLGEGMLDIVGETDVRWLPASERLLVDRTLFDLRTDVPTVIELPGDAAR